MKKSKARKSQFSINSHLRSLSHLQAAMSQQKFTFVTAGWGSFNLLLLPVASVQSYLKMSLAYFDMNCLSLSLEIQLKQRQLNFYELYQQVYNESFSFVIIYHKNYRELVLFLICLYRCALMIQISTLNYQRLYNLNLCF